MQRWLKILALGAAAVAFAGVYVHRVFWDRYLHAYSFESFIEHPFPEIDRLYPQEPVLGVPAPRALPVAAPAERSVAPSALAAAERFAEQSRSTALIVYHRGKIQYENYWLGARADRPVYSFSMHKTVVALLIGIAIAEGKITGVTEPLAKYIPEWVDDPRGRITLHDALQMASGFEPMAFPRNPFSKHTRRQIGSDIAAASMSYALVHTPGEHFEYNGANPTLLTSILERATGLRYAEYLSQKLWRPLGNRDATVWLDREGGLAMGATSLFAVPMDWLRLGVMLLEQGRVGDAQVVPASWLRAMTTPSKPNPAYGYLVWLDTKTRGARTLGAFTGFSANVATPFNADDVVYLDGLGGQRVYVIASKDLVIVRTGILSREYDEVTLPNLLIDGLQ